MKILEKADDMHMVDLVYHLFCNILDTDRTYCKHLEKKFKIIELMTNHMNKFLWELQTETSEGYQTPLCKTLCCNILECLAYIARYEAVKMSKDTCCRVLSIAMAITLTYKTETPSKLCDDDVRTLFICKKIFFEIARNKKIRPSIVSNDFVIEFMMMYLDPYSRLIPDQQNQKLGLTSDIEFACFKHVLGFINFMVELESHELIMKFVKAKAILKLGGFLWGEKTGHTHKELKRLALHAYSNMVVSTDSGMAITQIDAFLTEAPMTQIGKDMCFSNEIDHQRESAWVLTNILCCGSTEQVFQLWQMMEFCETDEDSQ